MPRPPTPGHRCAVVGCHAWALRDQDYCAPHYHQWQQNLSLGVPDPLPRLMGHNRRLCQARACKHLAIANSDYCAQHTEQYRGDAANSEAIAEGFAALLARLDADVALAQRPNAAPDCLAIVQRELDLLASARKILVAHAEMSSRAGWKLISSMTFIRLWLSSAATVTDLAKARFVMETATSADFDRLLGGVYSRIEREALPEQQPLPGILPAVGGADLCVRPDPPDPALQPSLFAVDGAGTRGSPCLPAPPGPQPGTRNPQLNPVTCHLPPATGTPARLSSPEAQLAEWLLDANAALGTRLVVETLRAFAAESPKALAESALDHAGTAALTALAESLPPNRVDAPPTPAQLGARLSTLADIMDQSPDLARVRSVLSHQCSVVSGQPPPVGIPSPRARSPVLRGEGQGEGPPAHRQQLTTDN